MAPGELLPASWPWHLASLGVRRTCHLAVLTCWAAQARGCAGTWGQGGGLSSHPVCFSVCLSIHLSSPLTRRGPDGDGQTQALQSEKPSLKEEASRTRDSHPEKTQAQTGPDIGQAKAGGRPGPLEGWEWRLRERQRLAQRRTAQRGQRQCWGRCREPQDRLPQAGPSPTARPGPWL